MTQTPYHLRPWRPAVGIMLIHPLGDIFVAQRLDTPGAAWQMPQGGMDEGEDPLTAALRELEEETGITPSKIDLISWFESPLFYDLPPELADRMWHGQYRGQRQYWGAYLFKGQNSDINLKTATPEFSAWRWASPKSLPNLAISFKKNLYQQLVDELYPQALKTLKEAF